MESAVRGTWDALFDEALRLTHDFDDRAVGLLEKLIAGLNRLPERYLDAGDERLRSLRSEAIDLLVRYHASRGRFAQAEQCFLREVPHQRPQELRRSPALHARLRWLNGDADSAGALLDASIRQHESTRDRLWADLDYMALLRFGQFDRAERWIAEIVGAEGWTQDKPAALAYRAALEANLELARGRLGPAAARLAACHAAGGRRDYNTESFAAEFVMGGRAALALEAIDADTPTETFAVVWKALALRALGRTPPADDLLRTATRHELKGADPWMLAGACIASYYLGDRKEIGLAAALDAADARTEFDHVIYPVAALGWALHGDLVAAKADFEIAVTRSRAALEGRLLHKEWWYHCTQLLDAQSLDAIRLYFDPTLTPERYL